MREMLGQYLYTAAMSISPDRETLLNEVYDKEHIPALKAVPGVLDVRRFRRIDPPGVRYLAVYEIASPDVPSSQDWLAARDVGRWPSEVRPFISGLHNGLYAWQQDLDVGQSPAGDSEAGALLVVRGSPSDVGPHLESAVELMRRTGGATAAASYVDVRDGSMMVASRATNPEALRPTFASIRELLPASITTEAYARTGHG